MRKGKLLIFCAPSGSGKSSIVKELMRNNPNLSFSISATSRAARGDEKDGVHYHFLSTEQFRKLIEEDAFLEWEEVYPGRFYGSLKSDVESIRMKGKDVVFDIDVVGGLNLKKQFKEDALAIFIQVPSLKILEERLRNRGTDSEEDIRVRLDKAQTELQYAHQFDRAVINDSLERCIEETNAIIHSFLEA